MRVALSDASRGVWATPMLAPTRTRGRLQVQWLVEARAQALSERTGAIGVGADQQCGELIAAHAGQEACSLQGPGEADSDLLQHLVADRVAEGVVDLLEAVEVDEQEGDWGLIFGHGREHGVKGVEHSPAVGQAGEVVGQ